MSRISLTCIGGGRNGLNGFASGESYREILHNIALAASEEQAAAILASFGRFEPQDPLIVAVDRLRATQ